MNAVVSERPAAERPLWRQVAVPSEHGGWGLTLEPVLLGLLVAWSWAGLALGVAAFAAFMARTPLKLVAVDRRRDRSLDRTRLAAIVAATEVVLVLALAAFAFSAAGPAWLIPVLIAAPLVAVEWWFDVRSRGRRLLPELAALHGDKAVWKLLEQRGADAVELRVPGPVPLDVDTDEDYRRVLAGLEGAL